MTEDPRNAGKLSYFEALRGRPRLEPTLSNSPDQDLRADLAFTYGWAKSGSLMRETQVKLAHDESPQVRSNTARSTSYRDLLDELIGDPNPDVRSSSAHNPRIERDQMELLLTDKLAGVRCAAICSGKMFPDAEQLLRAAHDKSSLVRWNVLFNQRTPRAAYELIANDSNEVNREHARLKLTDPEALTGFPIAELDVAPDPAEAPIAFEKF